MFLIAGLGNQGAQYAKTRHNIGFMAVDSIARSFAMLSGVGSITLKDKFYGQYAPCRYGDLNIILLKTGQYMNEGGRSVAAAAKFYKIPPSNIIVFHDELDLPPGKVKAKLGGGHAGHNGLRSIDQCLGNKNYWRLRLGIGHPRDRMQKNVADKNLDLDKKQRQANDGAVSSYVLGEFSRDEQIWLDPLLQDIDRYADRLISDNLDQSILNFAQAISRTN